MSIKRIIEESSFSFKRTFLSLVGNLTELSTASRGDRYIVADNATDHLGTIQNAYIIVAQDNPTELQHLIVDEPGLQSCWAAFDVLGNLWTTVDGEAWKKYDDNFSNRVSATTINNIPQFTDVNGTLGTGLGVQTTIRASGTADDNNVATESAIRAALDGVIAAGDAMVFKGTIGDGQTLTIGEFEGLQTYDIGSTYKVAQAGEIRGNQCEVGDTFIAIVGRTGSGSEDSDWTVLQTNIVGAVTTAGLTTGSLLKASGSNALETFDSTAGLSVLGRAANTAGAFGEITAANHEVLRRSGTSLGFGLLDSDNLSAQAKIALSQLDSSITQGTIIGRRPASGVGTPEILSGDDVRTIIGVDTTITQNRLLTGGEGNQITSAGISVANLVSSITDVTGTTGEDAGNESRLVFAAQPTLAGVKIGNNGSAIDEIAYDDALGCVLMTLST